MEDYNLLKPETFLFLLDDNETSISLIVASLLISFYNEKCIKEVATTDNKYKDLSERKFKSLVSSSFLKECSKELKFSNTKINKLDYMQKIKLVRNKLAHGDFVIDETKQNIIAKLNLKGEEITTSISINSIVSLAKRLSDYSRFPSSDVKRQTIYNHNGLEYKIIDIPKTKYGRNSAYDKKFDFVVNSFLYHRPFSQLLPIGALEAHKKIENKFMYLEFHVTEKDNVDKNNYPDRKAFENSMLFKLNNPLDKSYEGNEFVENLIDFYRYYIYSLENFLKVEDKNIMSLMNDKMFNFEDLILKNEDVLKSIENVGKINEYDDYFSILTNKSMEKYNKLVQQQNNEYYQNETSIQNLSDELDTYLSLFTSDSVAKFYPYSKKRSLIEHIRCSIEHGTYNYDESSSKIDFKDNWENNNLEFKINISEFMGILSNENKRLILEQFKKVYTMDEELNKKVSVLQKY